MFGVLWCSG